MKQVIELNFKKDEVDSFLKNKFGYGILEFELSILQTYMTFYYKNGVKVGRIADERVKQLINLKGKRIELFDDFFTEIKMYKHFKNIFLKIGISKWTPANKKKFITEKYKIDQVFQIIDEQIKNYLTIDKNLDTHSALWGIESMLYIKPINFLVLIWSYAMKKGKNIDWINMHNLMHWFSKTINETTLLEFLEFRDKWDQSSETLRSISNKYQNTKYNELAYYIYLNFFEKADKEYKKKYPQMISTLKKKYVGEKILSVNNWATYNDLIACLLPLL